MGSGQLKNTNTATISTNNMSVTHSRFMSSIETAKFNTGTSDKLKIEPFKRLLGWEL
jgi:hypothetical protein